MDPNRRMPHVSDLSIDADGNWRHEGVVITHERTWKLFSSVLKCDDQGRYILQIGPERAFVKVHDAPFVVQTLRLTDQGLRLRLKDETTEILDPASLRITPDNVPYCRVRDGSMEAKFSRTAYYELAEFVHEGSEGFYLEVNGQRYALKV